jgi:hypothetical protein
VITYTPPPIEQLVIPDYIGLPRYGQRDPRTNLTRTALDLLTRPQKANDFKPPVVSKLFSQFGSQQPIRLVNYKSLLTFLNSLPDGADPANIVPRGMHKDGSPKP